MNNIEIYKWLESQKYQTAYEETGEYEMYFSVDMPKILEDYAKFRLSAVSSRLNVYEYIWSKVFPNEELNYDDFYDWSRENANIALELALEYYDLNSY